MRMFGYIGANMWFREGKCDFADYYGKPYHAVWQVKIDEKADKAYLIRKTRIYGLRIMINEKTVVSFEAGRWTKHPPLNGVGRKVYKMVIDLYT